jgi:outer membrane protein OmpA-like peptidoglycan-associated protein
MNKLSAMRAQAVAAALEKQGVEKSQIVVVGHGGTRLASASDVGEEFNRRVEMMVIEVAN